MEKLDGVTSLDSEVFRAAFMPTSKDWLSGITYLYHDLARPPISVDELGKVRAQQTFMTERWSTI